MRGRITRGSLALGGLLAAGLAVAGPLELDRADRIHLAVVGATRAPGASWAADALLRDIAAWSPDRVLLTGGYVARGSAAEWRAFTQRWGALADRAVAVPDSAARRGDPGLRRWRRSGLGVPESQHTTWRAGTLTSQQVRWRVVVLDTTEPKGSRWLDQRSWIPKVTAGQDFDQLLVVTGAPLASLQRPATEGGEAVAELLDAAKAGGSRRLLGVFSGSTATNEVLLHAGSFGEVHLVAGNGAIPAADLHRSGVSEIEAVGELALVDGFDSALQRAWDLRREAPAPEVYAGDALPVRGWWQVALEGREISLAFRMEQADGAYGEVYRIRYTRRLGWVADG